MKKFLVKFLVFLIPLYFVIITYFIYDPFKVLGSYEDYYTYGFVPVNRDFVSTETWLKNQDRQHYNSFIFGSSRTLAFKTNDWKKYLGEAAIPFVFDASDENISGIFKKIERIHEKGIKIKNALLVLCTDATFVPKTLTADYLIVKHPFLSGQPRVLFQSLFLETFLSNGFFVRFLDYQWFRKYRHYMAGYLQEFQIKADSVTNDLFLSKESDILKDSLAYYHNIDYEFQKQSSNQHRFKTRLINNRHIGEMLVIRNIFDMDSTNYKIVISPVSDQVYFNRIDLRRLYSIFGKDKVFDFSGVNEITSNKFNYYERSHYRYKVGKRIMEQIYAKSNPR
jgi:hypothetical protein